MLKSQTRLNVGTWALSQNVQGFELGQLGVTALPTELLKVFVPSCLIGTASTELLGSPAENLLCSVSVTESDSPISLKSKEE